MTIVIDPEFGSVTLRFDQTVKPNIMERHGELFLELSEAPGNQTKLASLGACEVKDLAQAPASLYSLRTTGILLPTISKEDWQQARRVCGELAGLEMIWPA